MLPSLHVQKPPCESLLVTLLHKARPKACRGSEVCEAYKHVALRLHLPQRQHLKAPHCY